MYSLPRQHLLSLALATAFGSVPFWSTEALAQATGQTAAQVFDINVPAQALASAINELSRQTGTQVFTAGELVVGLSSRAVSGRMTAEQGLRELLSGTSLEAGKTANGGFAIRRMPNPPSSVTLSTVTVTDTESATGPVQGYVARRSAAGTKTDVPLIETPQSITIVGAEEIDTLKAQNIQDALGYVAGVTRSEALDRTTDTLIVRGFQLDGNNNQYRDGIKYTVNRYNGQQEPYGLERIELLKGAASVLYGAAAPGGIINTVSKRPTTTPLRELNLELGSFSRKQISGDFGGALSENGEWSYRLTFLKRDSNTFVDYAKDDRLFIAPSIKWQPNANTSFTVFMDYQKDNTMYIGDLPEEGTILPNVNGMIPRGRFSGEPGFDRFDLNRYSIGYLFEHAFNEKLKIRNNLRYVNAKNEYFWAWNYGLDSSQRILNRGADRRWDRSSGLITDTSLQYKATTGIVRHEVLVGFDYSMPRHETERYENSAAPIDIFNPIYGSPVGNEMTPLNSSSKSKTRQAGIYFQDHMKIDEKWVVLLGGRYDSVRYDESNYFTGKKSADNEKSHAFSGRAGVVYLADNGLAPFVSYSESFEPTTGVNRFSERYKPTSGKQLEAGIRYQPKGTSTLLSAAVYQLVKENVVVADPQDPTLTYGIQAGEVRSRGIELEARTAIGRNANLIFAYAYTDARTTKASPLQPEQEGRRSVGVPYNQFSIWGDYNFGSFGLPGLKIGAGMRYVGDTRSPRSNAVVPAYTLFDAMVSYTTGPWRFALNATNLTDKTYVGSCVYGCFYGEPRKVIGTATYRW